jgi:hypothetical protein
MRLWLGLNPNPYPINILLLEVLQGMLAILDYFFIQLQFLCLHAKIFAGTDFEGNVVNSSKMLNTNVDMQVDFR